MTRYFENITHKKRETVSKNSLSSCWTAPNLTVANCILSVGLNYFLWNNFH